MQCGCCLRGAGGGGGGGSSGSGMQAGRGMGVATHREISTHEEPGSSRSSRGIDRTRRQAWSPSRGRQTSGTRRAGRDKLIGQDPPKRPCPSPCGRVGAPDPPSPPPPPRLTDAVDGEGAGVAVVGHGVPLVAAPVAQVGLEDGALGEGAALAARQDLRRWTRAGGGGRGGAGGQAQMGEASRVPGRVAGLPKSFEN